MGGIVLVVVLAWGYGALCYWLGWRDAKEQVKTFAMIDRLAERARDGGQGK